LSSEFTFPSLLLLSGGGGVGGGGVSPGVVGAIGGDGATTK